MGHVQERHAWRRWDRWQRTAHWNIGLALILVLAGCAQPAMPAGVYLANVDGGAPRWIGAPAGAPVWSPQGSALAWGSEDGITRWSEESGATTVLTNAPVTGKPAWSPDGRSIAFLNRATSRLEIIDAETGASLMESAVANGPDVGRFGLVSLGGPSWAPDGSAVAFTCRDVAGDELCVVGADGRERLQLTRLEAVRETAPRASSNTGPPAWSPDGTMISVAAYPERRGAAAGVFIIDLESGSARRTTQLVPNSGIAWMSDSSRVVFSATSDGRSAIFVADAFGDTVVNATESLSRSVRNPSTSPDDGSLAVSSEGEILVLQGGRESMVVRLPGLAASDPAWSPDGEQIAFMAREDPIQTFD